MSESIFEKYEVRRFRRRASSLELKEWELEKFSQHSRLDYRAIVAMYDATPPHILTKLSLENDPVINRSVASNSNTPTEVLHNLSSRSDVDLNTLDLIAVNPNADATILDLLVQRQDAFLQMNVLKNNNISDDTLHYLKTNGQDYEVRDAARHLLRNRAALSALQF